MTAAVAALASALALPVSSLACTTFCLLSEDRIIVGKNYDWHIATGLLFVNKQCSLDRLIHSIEARISNLEPDDTAMAAPHCLHTSYGKSGSGSTGLATTRARQKYP